MVAALIVENDAQGRLGIEYGLGQDAGQLETDLVNGQSSCKVLKLDAQVDQEVVGQKSQRHMI